MTDITNLEALIKRLALTGDADPKSPQGRLQAWADEADLSAENTTELAEQRGATTPQFTNIPYKALAQAVWEDKQWNELQTILHDHRDQNSLDDQPKGTPDNPLDIVHVGGGPAAANFFIPYTVARENVDKPYTGAIIDQNEHPGYQWQGRTWIQLNNTTRKTQLFGSNLFGANNSTSEAGNTFPLGLPIGLQLPEVTMQRYAPGDIVGRLVELNATAGADTFGLDEEVLGVKDTEHGAKIITDEREVFADTAVLSGNQQPKKQPSEDEHSLGVYNLPRFRSAIRKGSLFSKVREELRAQGKSRDPNILVIGDGDSAKTVIEYLTGQAPERAYGPDNEDVVRDKYSIAWLGQDANTCGEYLEKERVRYSGLASLLPRTKGGPSTVYPIGAQAEHAKITTDAHGNPTYVVYSEDISDTNVAKNLSYVESEGFTTMYKPEITIWCTGFEPDPVDGVEPQAAPQPVTDKFGFPVAFPAQTPNGIADNILLHGQGTGRSVTTLGDTVANLFNDLGIEENSQALAFWGYSIMRHGFKQYENLLYSDGPETFPQSKRP